MATNDANGFKKKRISTSEDQWEGHQPPEYQMKYDALIT